MPVLRFGLQRAMHAVAGFAVAAAISSMNAHAATVIDAQALAQLKNEIETGQIPNVHSVLVEVHGRRIVDWYFKGNDSTRDGTSFGTVSFDADTLHDVRSVSKSIVSLLFGIALHEGAIKSIDTPVLDYFPEYPDLQTPERRKIRLRDVLRMSSGFHWDEYSVSYADPRNSETAMDAAPDRLRHVLSLPIDAPPGERFRYSGGDVALIGAVIARATGMPLDEYLRIKLFAPLGITKFVWLKDVHGVPYAASGLRMRPEDMMKIGEMMLHHGVYQDHQIVPRDWADAATSREIAVDTGSPCTAESKDHPSGLGFLHYGYFWWGGPGCSEQKRGAWFGAIGNGGERITVIPARDAVIVITAGLYNDPRQGQVIGVTARIEAALTPSPNDAEPAR